MNALLSFLPLFTVGARAGRLLAGCAVGPRYERPDRRRLPAWKEQKTAEGWLPAAPADALDRGEWWKLFGDATLDELAGRVQVSNQNIAAAVANYTQAQALVRGERAALFPSVSFDGSGQAHGHVGGNGTASPSNAFGASLGASWTPDVWGRLREAVSSAQANAQASEADLAAARLSAIGDLATNYFSLREADAEIVLLDETIQGYQRAFEITSNRYAAGISAQTDVLQAQTQLVNAKADRVGLQRTRATYEHAIATLLGVAPADFSLPAARWTPTVPGVPLGVPSTLLQRRPDIAAAERTVASANAQIGIARAAYFPNINLTASVGQQREPREGPVQLGQLAVVAGLLGGAGGVRRGRDRRQRRFGQGRLRVERGALPPDRAHRLPGGGRPAHRERHARRAGGPAPRGLGGGRQDRAATAQPLPRGAGELHRRGDGAGRRAQRAAHAGAVAGQPPDHRHRADPGDGRWLAGGVDGGQQQRGPGHRPRAQ
jgi:NodT family efflux transporter outer membrane factor (OMF) lipoprotein